MIGFGLHFAAHPLAFANADLPTAECVTDNEFSSCRVIGDRGKAKAVCSDGAALRECSYSGTIGLSRALGQREDERGGALPKPASRRVRTA